jgi:hypothetical protein
MLIPHFNEAALRQHATHKSFDRGTDYVQITTHYQPKSVTTVDTESYRSKTWQMMLNAAGYWGGEWGEEDPFDVELPEILAEVQAFIDRGEIESAQVVLMVITETIAREWYRVDEHDAESYLIVKQLDPIWANIILLSELSPEEIVDLQVELEECQDVWEDTWELTNSALLQE